MKTLANQKIVPNNTGHEWLEKNYPGFLNMIFMQGIHAGVYRSNQIYPFAFKSGYTIQKDMFFDWFWDLRDILRIRNIFIEKSKDDLKFFRRFYRRWEKDCKYNLLIYKKYEMRDFSKMPDKKLYDAYEEIYHANIGQAASGYLADSFLSVGDKDWLSDFISSRIKDKSKSQEAIKVLSAPTVFSYSNEEHKSLMDISRRIHVKFDDFDEFLRYIQKTSIIWKKLEKHAEEFYWIENNYFPKVLTTEDFAERLFGLFSQDFQEDPIDALQRNKEMKERLLKKIGDNYLTNVLHMSEYMTHIQDYRKMALVRFSHFVHIIFKEMAKRRDLTLFDLYNVIEPEMKNVFLKDDFDRKKLKLRSEKNFAYGSPEGYLVYEGEDYKKYVNESDFIRDFVGVREVKGVCACQGLVRGSVRLVRNANEVYDFKKGDILVTNNTTPDFVPLMKKAGAIVTEQGGITTHAAIISRELGIPCVIGTKIATKVFHDGDIVEVNAIKGTVRKIK